MKGLVLDHLPRIGRDLVALVGLPAALRFFEAYGGRTLEVAHGKRARGVMQLQELAEKVGLIAARKIVAHYKGAALFVPKCYQAMLAARDQALQARFDELTGTGGHSGRQAVALMVSEFNLADRSIYRALKRPAGEAAVTEAVKKEGQMDMFACP